MTVDRLYTSNRHDIFSMTEFNIRTFQIIMGKNKSAYSSKKMDVDGSDLYTNRPPKTIHRSIGIRNEYISTALSYVQLLERKY